MEKLKLDFILPDDNFAGSMENIVTPLLDSCEQEMKVEAEDGAPIHAVLYRNPASDTVICISHGFTEFIAKYSETIYMFLKAGYSVAICEHRGHGWSARALENLSKVHIDSYDTYVKDYRCFVEQVKEECPGQRLFLYGHSMGGCIAALYLETYPEDFEVAVLSSPMLDIDSAGLPKFMCYAYGRGKVLRHQGEQYLGSQEQNYPQEEKFEDSCYDNEERFEYWTKYRESDEYLQTTAGTIEWMTASLAAAAKAVRHADQIGIPVLLCQAGKDTMVKPDGQMNFVGRAPFAKVRIFPESNHEICNSVWETRRTFWRSVLGFFGMH